MLVACRPVTITAATSGRSLRALHSAFSKTVSWVKVSSDTRYRFNVIGMGVFQPHFKITAHSHLFYEVGLVLDGEGTLSIAKAEHKLMAGDVFVVGPDQVHRVWASGERRMECFMFQVSVESLGKNGAPKGLINVEGKCLRRGEALLKLVESWAEVQQTGLGNSLSLSLFSRFLVYEILSLYGNVETMQGWSLVDKAKEFIEESLSDRLDVPKIAAAMNVSERTLRRHFKQELGISVIDYINDRRFELAQRYLSLHVGVTDIAKMVGFETSGQLSRLFQKRQGVLPKTWQQRMAPTRRRAVPV